MPSVTNYSNKFGKKPLLYAIFREPSWKAMVVRNYLVREVWVSMRSSSVFSRVPGTIQCSDQNLRLSESKRYHKTITQYMYYNLHLPSLPTHDRVTHITGTVSVSTESFLSNVVLGGGYAMQAGA